MRNSNRPFVRGDRVELNVAHRPGKGIRRGTIKSKDRRLPEAVLVSWEDGHEQLCDRSDLRRVSR